MAARPVKSQWDFGELFPEFSPTKVFTVSELTAKVKSAIEKNIGLVKVSGEVANLRAQASGHMYFTLRDSGAQLACVLFRGDGGPGRDFLEDGRQVVLDGQMTVYEPRGQYQLQVTKVELHGVGALQLAFERLKARLGAEGLFAPERKRPLPRYPERVGLVTSPTGAALRDVLRAVQRRNPAIEFVLAPCRVQGAGAAEEIATAIRLLNEWHASAAGDPDRKLDLILVTRGGGSLEDLWAFNEESVARAICASTLPVISAVGHEIDFTISDFVADLRAATPTAAAEIITEGVFSSLKFLDTTRLRLQRLAQARHARCEEALEQLGRRLLTAHPRNRLNLKWQRLDDLDATLRRVAQFAFREARNRLDALDARWRRLSPGRLIERLDQEVAQARQSLARAAQLQFERRQNAWSELNTRLEMLSPDRVLARGYSITMDAGGRILRSAAETAPREVLTSRLHEGQVRSVVSDRQLP